MKSKRISDEAFCQIVALFVSAWIEITSKEKCKISITVALFVSAWIEIVSDITTPLLARVALFVSAWIEIYALGAAWRFLLVALFVSAWIEIILGVDAANIRLSSHSFYECVGLKSVYAPNHQGRHRHTPGEYVG